MQLVAHGLLVRLLDQSRPDLAMDLNGRADDFPGNLVFVHIQYLCVLSASASLRFFPKRDSLARPVFAAITLVILVAAPPREAQREGGTGSGRARRIRITQRPQRRRGRRDQAWFSAF